MNSNLQIQLFQQIKIKLPPQVSLVDEMAAVLDISTDSAYRRIRGEKPLSLEEVYKLCIHFKLSLENIPEQRMNGDSLMIGLGKLLNATVVASESFVMTKPGIFKSGYSLAGSPTRKKFKDPIYKPVWEHLGTWNCYQAKSDSLYKINTVSLSRSGSISFKKKNFLSLTKKKKKQEKTLLALKRGNYNLAALYRQN